MHFIYNLDYNIILAIYYVYLSASIPIRRLIGQLRGVLRQVSMTQTALQVTTSHLLMKLISLDTHLCKCLLVVSIIVATTLE